MNRIKFDGQIVKINKSEKMTFIQVSNVVETKKQGNIETIFKCSLWNSNDTGFELNDVVEIDGQMIQKEKTYQGNTYKTYEVQVIGINLIKSNDNDDIGW